MAYTFNPFTATLDYYQASGTGNAPSNAILLKDSNGVLWALTVDPTGNLDTVSLGAQSYTPAAIVLTDSSSVRWNLTVTVNGNLDTELA